MDNTFTLKIDLPEEILNRIEERVIKAIDCRLNDRLAKHLSQPVKLSRSEVARMLRVSLPTLSSYTKLGHLHPQKIGRRVLFDQNEVENFLRASSIH